MSTFMKKRDKEIDECVHLCVCGGVCLFSERIVSKSKREMMMVKT